MTLKQKMLTARAVKLNSVNATALAPTNFSTRMAGLMSLQAACLASLQAHSDTCAVLLTNAGSGPKPSESLASFDPDTRSLKTRQVLLFSPTSTESLATLPRSGMTCCGMLFRLPPLVQDIRVSASCSLLPTPTTRDWKDTPGMAREVVERGDVTRGRADQLPRRIFADVLPPAAGGMKLTPAFLCWLMGFPTDWLKALVAALATPSSPNSPKSSPKP